MDMGLGEYLQLPVIVWEVVEHRVGEAVEHRLEGRPRLVELGREDDGRVRDDPLVHHERVQQLQQGRREVLLKLPLVGGADVQVGGGGSHLSTIYLK